MLEQLSWLVGTWATQATHPAMPGVVVHGSTEIEWLEGERFLIIRGRTDHADFPDSISIIGITDADRVEDTAAGDGPSIGDAELSMHYFDSRGVFRLYLANIDEQAWRYWRDTPGFSQRFTGTRSDDGDTIDGTSQLRRDTTWEDDLQITYRRQR